MWCTGVFILTKAFKRFCGKVNAVRGIIFSISHMEKLEHRQVMLFTKIFLIDET